MLKVFELQEPVAVPCLWHSSKAEQSVSAACLCELEMWPGQTLALLLNARAAAVTRFQETASAFKRRKIFQIYLIGNVFIEVTSFAVFYT